MNRRDFLRGMLAAVVAPAFVKTAGLLMPVKPIISIPDQFIIPTDVLGEELLAITRRAFLPKQIIQIYKQTPSMLALLQAQPASGGDRVVIPVSW